MFVNKLSLQTHTESLQSIRDNVFFQQMMKQLNIHRVPVHVWLVKLFVKQQLVLRMLRFYANNTCTCILLSLQTDTGHF